MSIKMKRTVVVEGKLDLFEMDGDDESMIHVDYDNLECILMGFIGKRVKLIITTMENKYK